MISHCLWQIYIRLCSFHFFRHHFTTFTFTHLQDSYYDISRDCVLLSSCGRLKTCQKCAKQRGWVKMTPHSYMRELTKVQHTQTSNGYLFGLLFSVSGTMKWGIFSLDMTQNRSKWDEWKTLLKLRRHWAIVWLPHCHWTVPWMDDGWDFPHVNTLP